tara:strand:+ start:2268 stop:2423 length:156 start_codon:yes stop_codon:yes gene_type:complete
VQSVITEISKFEMIYKPAVTEKTAVQLPVADRIDPGADTVINIFSPLSLEK